MSRPKAPLENVSKVLYRIGVLQGENRSTPDTQLRGLGGPRGKQVQGPGPPPLTSRVAISERRDLRDALLRNQQDNGRQAHAAPRKTNRTSTSTGTSATSGRGDDVCDNDDLRTRRSSPHRQRPNKHKVDRERSESENRPVTTQGCAGRRSGSSGAQQQQREAATFFERRRVQPCVFAVQASRTGTTRNDHSFVLLAFGYSSGGSTCSPVRGAVADIAAARPKRQVHPSQQACRRLPLQCRIVRTDDKTDDAARVEV